jgi:hypothetical protein
MISIAIAVTRVHLRIASGATVVPRGRARIVGGGAGVRGGRLIVFKEPFPRYRLRRNGGNKQ